MPVRDTTYQPLDIAVAGEPEARPNGAYPVLLSRWDDLQQLREVLGDCDPEDVQVDVEVVMDEPVTHARSR